MPYYSSLKGRAYADRTSERLLALRRQLRKEIPPKTVRDSLLLASWNIRDFDSNKFGHGARLPESFFYIAEIISSFDLVAVQEVNEDLKALKRLMRILGPAWDYIATDITAGKSGNRERMAFVYDTRKVTFQHIAGEVVLPTSRTIDGERQFARTPFLVSFQSGWFAFNLCTVHLYYGADSGEKLQRRIAEIDRIAQFLAQRTKKQTRNFILLGDFNIVSPEHRTMTALLKHGFQVPPPLRDKPTNMFGTRHYDQIAFMGRKDDLQLGDSKNNADAFNFYKSVFRPKDAGIYYEFMDPQKRDFDNDGNPQDAAGKKDYFRKIWRTFQMSDHLPLWVQLKIDFSDRYLQGLRHVS